MFFGISVLDIWLEVTMSTRKYWRVIGYDSTRRIFEEDIPLGTFTERQMAEALRALAARAGLTYSEILDCYAKRSSKRYNALLEVQVDARREYSMSCGSNPYFIASVVEK